MKNTDTMNMNEKQAAHAMNEKQAAHAMNEKQADVAVNEKHAGVAVNEKEGALADKITRLVNEYIENFDRFDSNPQIRINPATLAASLVNGRDMAAAVEDSDEAVEDAAAAEGLETEYAADFQAAQNPVFVAVKSLLKTTHSGTVVPSAAAIVAAARM